MENEMNENCKTTYIRELSTVKPSANALTTVCITNDIIEVKVHEYGYQNNLSRFKKINKLEYLDIETGEIIRFQSQNGRGGQNSSSTRNWNRAFERLRRIINYNFEGKQNELHMILTYGENNRLIDRDEMAKDFKNFWKRLKYHFGNMEYILMFEPDSHGKWHIHVLAKSENTEKLFLDNQMVQRLWHHGFTKVRSTRGNDNIGAYFTVLLNGNRKSKKSSRIQYYEKYKKLYTKSRGILIPPIYHMTYQEAEQLLQGHKKVFEKGLSVVSIEDDKELNRIYIMQYNDKKR